MPLRGRSKLCDGFFEVHLRSSNDHPLAFRASSSLQGLMSAFGTFQCPLPVILEHLCEARSESTSLDLVQPCSSDM
jgi:hypothetical protein